MPLLSLSVGKARSRLTTEAVIVAASDSKNIRGPTTSFGTPTPRVAFHFSLSAPSLAERYCGVSMTPGAMILTRTLCSATSLATLLTKAINAALLAA